MAGRSIGPRTATLVRQILRGLRDVARGLTILPHGC